MQACDYKHKPIAYEGEDDVDCPLCWALVRITKIEAMLEDRDAEIDSLEISHDVLTAGLEKERATGGKNKI